MRELEDVVKDVVEDMVEDMSRPALSSWRICSEFHPPTGREAAGNRPADQQSQGHQAFSRHLLMTFDPTHKPPPLELLREQRGAKRSRGATSVKMLPAQLQGYAREHQHSTNVPLLAVS